jgi:N-dimethylarginine dimethylaminohydrolase
MRVGSVRARHAVRQHAAFVRVLELSGASLETVPFVHGAYDSVFSKDNALLVERADGATQALLGRPRHAERRSEQHARAVALAGLGIRVTAAAESPLEGGDVVILPDARGAFLGHGFRSSRRASRDLERFLDREVTCVELRDPRLYHLDMALSVLDDGTALVCEEALTEASFRAIRRHAGIRAIVRVPVHEALQFGVNLVQVGDTIVWGAQAPATTRALGDLGYRVRHVELEQFHRAGGSAACLVSRIHRQALGAMNEVDEAPRSTAA